MSNPAFHNGLQDSFIFRVSSMRSSFLLETSIFYIAIVIIANNELSKSDTSFIGVIGYAFA